jgi:hypothetical protein
MCSLSLSPFLSSSLPLPPSLSLSLSLCVCVCVCVCVFRAHSTGLLLRRHWAARDHQGSAVRLRSSTCGAARASGAQAGRQAGRAVTAASPSNSLESNLADYHKCIWQQRCSHHFTHSSPIWYVFFEARNCVGRRHRCARRVHADHWPSSYSPAADWGLGPHAHRLVKVLPRPFWRPW